MPHQIWFWGIRCCRWQRMRERWSNLAWKPRADISRSPKLGYQWSHKRTNVLWIFRKKCHLLRKYFKSGSIFNLKDSCSQLVIPKMRKQIYSNINQSWLHIYVMTIITIAYIDWYTSFFRDRLSWRQTNYCQLKLPRRNFNVFGGNLV